MNMNEGTSIGEIDSFDLTRNGDSPQVDDYTLKATKIGEISEFEKEFVNTDDKKEEKPKESVKSNKAADNIEADKKTLKTELEKFLDEETSEVFDYENGDVIQGTVRAVEKAGVLVDFNFKSDGYISNSELGVDENGKTETLEAGQTILLFIDKLETKEGYSLLSRKKAQIEETWDLLINAVKERDPINVYVVSKVEGGLVASYQSIRGFIPASQILKENDLGLDQFINSTMSVTVLQADRRRRKIIFSSKATKVSNREQAGKLLDELEVGQTRQGKVTSIKKFGVFVDLGGIEGLIHISELSWSRVNNPADFVSLGDEINVFVLGVDRENRRISLGMKQLNEDPWVRAGSAYTIGDFVEGKITRIVPFGAFIQITDNIEGLIHISEMSYDHIEKVENILTIGDKVKAKIIKLIIDEQKIGLTLKFDDKSDDNKSNDQENKEDDSINTTKQDQEKEEIASTEGATDIAKQEDVSQNNIQVVSEEDTKKEENSQPEQETIPNPQEETAKLNEGDKVQTNENKENSVQSADVEADKDTD
ncbi:hypothetical protein DID74_02145 [Candidatus Marinamargulisbacteria bacterium SCGC AG-333-B06]|nr:hypothetical protein DID74_02145 [Candidatus Marinamargulisbacteria bacterium SCGC AG-333-B06]